MNRRSFFRSMIGGVAASAAVRTWPFRVFSFPTEVVLPKSGVEIMARFLTEEELGLRNLTIIRQSFRPPSRHDILLGWADMDAALYGGSKIRIG